MVELWLFRILCLYKIAMRFIKLFIEIFFLFVYYKNNKTMGGGLMQLVAYGAQDIYLKSL
jgi:hypothetical protein